MTYGYIRLRRKIDVKKEEDKFMKEIDLDKSYIYVDIKSKDRLDCLKKKIEKGDLLYLKSIFHLGNTSKEVLNCFRYLMRKDIDIKVLDIPMLDTIKYNTSKEAIFEFVDQFLKSIYKENLKDRRAKQKDGIEKAKEEGIQIGRPKIEVDENFKKELLKWSNKEQSLQETYENLGISKSSLYRIIKENEELVKMLENNKKNWRDGRAKYI